MAPARVKVILTWMNPPAAIVSPVSAITGSPLGELHELAGGQLDRLVDAGDLDLDALVGPVGVGVGGLDRLQAVDLVGRG